MFNIFKPKLAKEAKPKTLGQLGEEWAQEEYRKKGYKIIGANVYNTKGKRAGEIDFIAVNKTNIIFVEVKTRKFGANKFGTGIDAVNIFKQQKILLAVKMFLLREPKYKVLCPQIDVCSLVVRAVDKKDYSVTILVNSVEDWN